MGVGAPLLVDVAQREPPTTVLGQRISMPVPQHLRNEFEFAMALAGRSIQSQIDRSLVQRV
jgi:hypothetical protein